MECGHTCICSNSSVSSSLSAAPPKPKCEEETPAVKFGEVSSRAGASPVAEANHSSNRVSSSCVWGGKDAFWAHGCLGGPHLHTCTLVQECGGTRDPVASRGGKPFVEPSEQLLCVGGSWAYGHMVFAAVCEGHGVPRAVMRRVLKR